MDRDRRSRRSRRAIWLLMVVGAFALALVIRSALARSSPQSKLRMPALGAGQAAKAAYATMTQWASGWASDAAVVNCTTSCTRNDGGSDAWQFQVHSADLGRIAAARVQGSEVVVLRESAALFKQRPLPLDAWKLDSSQAVQVWWNNGGQTAWNQPDTEALHVRLGLNTDSRLTWQFTVTYGADDALGFWEISAQDGVLLSQNAGVANE